MWAEPIPGPGCGEEQEPGPALWAQSRAWPRLCGAAVGRGRRWRKWFLKEMRCEHSALALSVWPPASIAVGKQSCSQEPRGWQELWCGSCPGLLPPAQPPATAHHSSVLELGLPWQASSHTSATLGVSSPVLLAKSSPPGHPSEPSPWHSWQHWLAKAPAQNQPSPSFVPFY